MMGRLIGCKNLGLNAFYVCRQNHRELIRADLIFNSDRITLYMLIYYVVCFVFVSVGVNHNFPFILV